MKRITFFALVIVWLLMTASCALAEEVKQPLTLQQCIDLAMKNQTDLITGRNNVLIAKGRTAETLAAYLPQISIVNNAFNFGTGSVLNKSTNGTALSINQNIYDGGLREASTSGARYGVIQNSAGLSRTVQTVTYTVTKAYYEALRAKHLADVADASVKYNEGLRDQIEGRAKEGDVAKVDVLPVEAALANARVSALTAQHAMRSASLQLQNAMGLSPTQGFDIQEAPEAPALVVGPLETYLTTAAAARPDVLQSKANSGAARASLRAARISLYPRPVIGGQYQRQVQGGFTTSGGQVTGGIVFDLFNGGANRAVYKEAQAGQANANQLEQQTQKDIQAQVEEGYLNLSSTKERLAASDVSLTAAQTNYDVQKDRYSQGLGTTLDLLNAEVQLITAQYNLVQARYDYYIAIAQMDFAVGKQGGFNAS